MQISFFRSQALGASPPAASGRPLQQSADIVDLPQDPGSGALGILEHFQVWKNVSTDLKRPNFTVLAS